MHQPIQDHFEHYLSDPGDPSIPRTFREHLASCPGCAQELAPLNDQSRVLRSLRSEGLAEPGPGFYARVMNRIEQTPSSIWSVFLEPVFGRRLAFACGALVLLLGTYMVSSDPIDHNDAPTAVMSVSQDRTLELGRSVQPQMRDAVLASLVSFQE